MLKLLSSCTLTEKILLGILSLIILISGFQIGSSFFKENSEPVPSHGGAFVEGVVGSFNFINPVLEQTNLDRDLTSLVFCGLTRFDPISNSIVDNIATHTLSPDQRTYTFTIKKDVYWHDGQPVTADDVIFTFREIIQNEEFPNPTLASDFFDVLITKIDDYTVTMTLKKKYAFFIYNTTVGLLPKHILGNTPASELLSSDFNLKPIGCGPYKVDAVTQNLIQLSAFEDYFKGRPYLNSIIFRIFESAEQLAKSIDSISGTKDLGKEQIEALANDARMDLHDFNLPQYVALFFNTDREFLRDKKTRLGLQLATNKQEIIDSLKKRNQIIDTPLLEITSSNWKYEFDASRADGALYDAGWRYQDNNKNEKVAAKTSAVEPKIEIESEAEFIDKPSSEQFFTTSEAGFFIEGTAPAGSTKIIVNGYQLSKFKAGSTTWSYKASTTIGTLKEGENEYIVKNQNGEIDRISIFYSNDEAAKTKWLSEKQKPIVEEFVETEILTVEKEEPVVSQTDRLRYKDNQALSLKLLIPESREEFLTVGEILTEQWAERGVKLIIERLPDQEFFIRLNKRDYDMVLFGQNLGYNLDAYPFWHSSEARENSSNLSNLKSSAVNAWLEQVRSSFDSSERRKRLADLREVMSDEVPAIMLYTPTYSYAVDKKIKNFNLGRIALKRDRFANLANWYLRESRKATSDIGIWSFLSWLWKNL